MAIDAPSWKSVRPHPRTKSASPVKTIPFSCHTNVAHPAYINTKHTNWSHTLLILCIHTAEQMILTEYRMSSTECRAIQANVRWWRKDRDEISPSVCPGVLRHSRLNLPNLMSSPSTMYRSAFAGELLPMTLLHVGICFLMRPVPVMWSACMCVLTGNKSVVTRY